VKSAVALLVIPNLVMDSLQLRRSGPLGNVPRRLALLLVFSMIGTVIGTKLLVALSARTATLVLGGFILGYVLLDLARFSPRIPAGWERRLAAPVGLAAGIMGGITNAPGTAIAPRAPSSRAVSAPRPPVPAASAAPRSGAGGAAWRCRRGRRRSLRGG